MRLVNRGAYTAGAIQLLNISLYSGPCSPLKYSRFEQARLVHVYFSQRCCRVLSIRVRRPVTRAPWTVQDSRGPELGQTFGNEPIVIPATVYHVRGRANKTPERRISVKPEPSLNVKTFRRYSMKN